MTFTTLAAAVTWHARRTPDAAAVLSQGGRMSYRQLLVQARTMGAAVRHACKHRPLAAILLPRSPDYVTATVAAQMAGIPYVPMDPTYPRDRIDSTLADARVSAVIVTRDEPTPPGIHRIEVPLPPTGEAGGIDPAPERWSPTGNETAYVMYTSGSTGTPKGVVVPHRALTNLVMAMVREMELGNTSRVLSVSSFAFDMSVAEIYPPLYVGGAVIVPTTQQIKDPHVLLNFAKAHGATHFHATPTLWGALLEAGAGSALRDSAPILSGAEPLPWHVASQLLATGSRVVNLYGPTETTVWSTATTITGPGEVGIGTPLPRTDIHILDANLQPTVAGETGEIYISGWGLADGYLYQPKLTASKFVPNPFGPPGSRLYRTGDFGRRTATGGVQFLGRTDLQVKVRGHRVELHEVEAAYAAHPSVRACAVQFDRDPSGDSRLTLFVEPKSEVDPADLRRAASRMLADYMQPSTISVVECLPRTPNGKIDRAALPPSLRRSALEATTESCDVQAKIVNAFAHCLGTAQVNPDDSLFDLGGHSLTAIRIARLLSETLGTAPAVTEIFEHPTPAELAGVIRRRRPGHGTGFRKPCSVTSVPATISPSQERAWLAHHLDPTQCAYNMPYAWRIDGGLQPAAFMRACTEVLAEHPLLANGLRDASGRPEVVEIGAAKPQLNEVALPQTRALLHQEARRPFNLAEEVPIRVRLYRFTPQHHCLLIVAHHVAFDGASISILTRQLSARYRSIITGAPLAVVGSRPYSDWIASHTYYLNAVNPRTGRNNRTDQLEYWTRNARPVPVGGRLSPGSGGRVTFEVPEEILQAARMRASRCRSTTAIVVQACLAVYIFRRTGTRHVSLGGYINGRPPQGYEATIGYFGNLYHVIYDFEHELTFDTIINQATRRNLDIYENADVPYQEVVRALAAKGPSFLPQFRIVFAWHPPELAPIPPQLPGCDISELPVDTATSKFDLSVEFADGGDSRPTVLTVEYADSYLTRDAVSDWVKGFVSTMRTCLLTHLPYQHSFDEFK